MSKKPKTEQTNPRRTKGRIYSLPEANDGPKALPPEVLDAAIVNKANVDQIPAESICDKARRLANEAEETKKRERAERELAFMRKMFETDDLASAGVVIDKVREDGTIEYLICGRRWVYGEQHLLANAYSGYLINLDNYMGFNLSHGMFVSRVNNLKDFGALLQYMDKREAELRVKYPDNWWGRFKAKWA